MARPAGQIVSYFPLIGGEDVVTPPIVLEPGRLLFSKNYEPAQAGGYRRIDGFERFDGQVKPSEATFLSVPFDAGENEPNVGDEMSWSSGGTGVTAGFEVTSGSFAGNDAAGFLAIYNFSGTFADNATIINDDLANTFGAQDGDTQGQSASTEELFAEFIQAAIEGRRADIQKVPGEGDILGIWGYRGDKYAFRNAVGGATAEMFKNATFGWVPQILGRRLTYINGSNPTNVYLRGETILGATSGATGIITEFTLTSGSFSGNDAAGTFYLHTVVGFFVSGEVIVGQTTSVASLTSDVDTEITLPPDGKYDFVNHNFFGQSDDLSFYATNGVGFPIIWNGSGLALIEDTGVPSNVFATHIAAQADHLMLTFKSSLIFSEIGNPIGYDTTLGAGEIAVGDDITGLNNTQGDVLTIFSENSTRLLFGTSAADFVLKVHSPNTGGREWTIQHVFNTRFLDDRGLTQLQATLNFGDFKENTFSQFIDPLLRAKLGLEIDSVVVREKDQYRIFFSDNTALFCRVDANRNFPQFTRVEYPLKVLTANTTEDSTGKEEIFFGSEDGFIYQMDAGTSFDGVEMEYQLRLPFNNLKSPRTRKRFLNAILEIDAPAGITLRFAPDFSYGSDETPKGIVQSFDISSGGGFWDNGIEWADFFWGGQSQGEAKAYLKGSGLNMSLLIIGESTYEESHTITGITLQYVLRGTRR